jgi:hypothetical protein
MALHQARSIHLPYQTKPYSSIYQPLIRRQGHHCQSINQLVTKTFTKVLSNITEKYNMPRAVIHHKQKQQAKTSKTWAHPELQKISTLTHSELMTFNCHNNNFLKNNLGKNIENGKTKKKKTIPATWLISTNQKDNEVECHPCNIISSKQSWVTKQKQSNDIHKVNKWNLKRHRLLSKSNNSTRQSQKRLWRTLKITAPDNNFRSSQWRS